MNEFPTGEAVEAWLKRLQTHNKQLLGSRPQRRIRTVVPPIPDEHDFKVREKWSSKGSRFEILTTNDYVEHVLDPIASATRMSIPDLLIAAIQTYVAIANETTGTRRLAITDAQDQVLSRLELP